MMATIKQYSYPNHLQFSYPNHLQFGYGDTQLTEMAMVSWTGMCKAVEDTRRTQWWIYFSFCFTPGPLSSVCSPQFSVFVFTVHWPVSLLHWKTILLRFLPRPKWFCRGENNFAVSKFTFVTAMGHRRSPYWTSSWKIRGPFLESPKTAILLFYKAGLSLWFQDTKGEVYWKISYPEISLFLRDVGN